MQKRRCLWGISVMSNFHIFSPKWERSSCLAKVDWDRKFNSVHRPILGSTAIRLRYFWCPLVDTDLHNICGRIYIREVTRVLISACCHKPLGTVKHMEGALHRGAASSQGKQQWIKLLSLTEEALKDTIFKHQVWKRFCSPAGSGMQVMCLQQSGPDAGLGDCWTRGRKLDKVNHWAPSFKSLLYVYFDEITVLQHF